MAWRPMEFLLEGELDNTRPGRVTGWMQFRGIQGKIALNLKGNFHRDIRGERIRFSGDGYGADEEEARRYFEGFVVQQTGKVGDVTARKAPNDCVVGYPHIEWHSDQNGRVVIELEPEQLEANTCKPCTQEP